VIAFLSFDRARKSVHDGLLLAENFDRQLVGGEVSVSWTVGLEQGSLVMHDTKAGSNSE
jgi:hypothetical protein